MLVQRQWPIYEETLIKANILTIPIQVNGKLRSKLIIPADWTKEQILDAALADSKIGELIKGKTITKQIYIEKRLVNIVVDE
jgi:leucyl-tRNA synthetase